MLLADVVFGPPEIAIYGLPFMLVFAACIVGIRALLKRPKGEAVAPAPESKTP